MLDLSYLGLTNVGAVHQNLSTPALYEAAIKRGEGQVGHLGPLVVSTGKYTGRSADDKFVVRDTAARFAENFRAFADRAPEDVTASGPTAS